MAIDFNAKQLEFTRYIRNPEKCPAPADVKPERIAMYRELIFNNLDGFLSNNFPVIRKILDDTQWQELVRDFIAKHHSKTPYFSEIAEEFLDYLENERHCPDDFPFLLELAHYEWVEMALSISKEELSPFTELRLDQLPACKVKLSPLAWPLAYQYPVQLISPDYLPMSPPEQPSFLVAYRDPEDCVKFIEINAMTYRLLEIIQEREEVITTDCLQQVARESQHAQPDIIINGGLKVLIEMTEKSVVAVAN